VNSAFFGLRQATTSIGRAVGMLGTNTVRALASVTSIIRSTDLDPAFVEHFDAHSQRVGAAAARFCPPDLRDHTPSAGLLHDIGWLVLADRARERFAELCARARVEGLDADLERTVFGATHSDVGAALLALWGLPIELVECTAWHHDGDAPSVLARAVLSGHDGDSGLGGWLGLVTTTDVS
jgi:HD-like signal output (HDOD) protein